MKALLDDYDLDSYEIDEALLDDEMDGLSEYQITKGEESFRRQQTRGRKKGKTRDRRQKILNSMDSISKKSNKVGDRLVNNINKLQYK